VAEKYVSLTWRRCSRLRPQTISHRTETCLGKYWTSISQVERDTVEVVYRIFASVQIPYYPVIQ
jgi:hypothetical protein